MTEKRIQFSNIVQNQLPAYVREEYPLISEFLKQYYISQEFQGASIDLIQNIDEYIKLNETTNLSESVILGTDLGFNDDIVYVDLSSSETGTDGFPDSYGLLQIDEEIITYTGKTFSSFTGCIRGFCGITTYVTENNPEQLTFSTSSADEHFGSSYDSSGQISVSGTKIKNLSILFLKQFLIKTKHLFLPKLDGKNLTEGLNENLFIKQSKDFYLSRGTDRSFEILFKALYNEDVKVVRPSEYLITPSNADYRITNDLVVESISGDPLNLINSALYQDTYGDSFFKSYAPITSVEKVISDLGQVYYKISYDAGYNRNSRVDGSLYGSFSVHPKTKAIGQYQLSYFNFIVTVTSNPGTPPPNNVFVIDGIIQQNLNLIKGNTYRFDLSSSSNIGHPLIFQKISGENLSSTYYTTSSNGSPGTTGSFVDLIIASNAPNETIKYNCSNHNGMGANIDVIDYSIGQFKSSPTIIDVDSTVGFPNSGELEVIYNDQTIGVVSYTSKSLTQFYGCSGVSGTILDGSNISINTYAYGKYYTFENIGSTSVIETEEIVKVRINSVLNDIEHSNSIYQNPKDSIFIKTLGSKSEDFVSRNWFYNISSSYKVLSLSVIDISNNSYKIVLDTKHYFKHGDKIFITGSDSINKDSSIIEILSDVSFSIKGQGILSLTDDCIIKRKILKAQSNIFPDISNYSANIQNVYTDSSEINNKSQKILIASQSLPYYDGQPLDATDRSIIFSGTFSGDQFTISSKEHNFYTGDAIYYTPQKTIENYFEESVIKEREIINSFLFDEGLYFIKRINSTTIKFSKSRTDIFYSKFISLDNTTTVIDNKLEQYKFVSKTLFPQNLLREISKPILDGKYYETEPKFNGILVNGVEILNYKSSDIIYYGKLNEIEVISPGSNYDIINPPLLSISDSIGVGATGYVTVSGSLREIRILDSGFDYIETPTVNINGGNGSGALASVNMKLIEHSSDFFADPNSAQVSIGSSLSTIGFSTYHKFRNAEQVIYSTQSQTEIGGIVANSSYFVSVIGPSIIKLHKTQADAISGINTVTLSSYGVGRQSLKSYNKKSVVESINVVSSGLNYQNKKRTTNSSGINTSSNQITIDNHDYNSGEIIKYTVSGTSVGGLTNNSEYYATKIDNNTFKLSLVGIASTSQSFYYDTKQYINLTSVGVGTHIFNYSDITVTLKGKIGISSISGKTFEAEIQPIFRGSVISVHLENKGVGYGSSEVINLERTPSISLKSGQDAQLFPIVSNGKISEVLVSNIGKSYNSPPNLLIFGSGIGAVITPVITNGFLTSVKVIESGIGYSQESTSAVVIFPGSGADFKVKIQRWRINLFEKYFNTFTGDDGFIHSGINEKYQLQYCHLYAPRKLRESLFSSDQTGKILYGKRDLTRSSNVEVLSTDHSPIIGWAYDGHPIYGPYGYITKSGGIASQIKSGYKLNSSREYGPSPSVYPLGFFVEDYIHKNVSDETVLDENNGRFCTTPEFPEGTYAYFATFDTLSVDSSLPFLGYKRPEFPYLIGNNFKGIPNKFNYKLDSNQDEFNLNTSNLFRNTAPYNLINGTTNYEYLNIPNKLNQKSEITSVLPGEVEGVKILNEGNEYQINNVIVFDETNTRGYNAKAKVSKILGKSVNTISVATSSITNVEISPSENLGIYNIICINPHNFSNNDRVTITGLSTTSSKIEGSYSISIGSTGALSITGFGTTSSGIQNVTVTGIVTYFNVTGRLSNLRENDILSLGSERVRILNVEPHLSRIRVLRGIDGTTGTAHTVTTILYEDSRIFSINAGFKTTYNYKQNKEIYFNPTESIGLGTVSGVGIGTTIFLSNPGTGITQIFIPTKSIYIRNHNLETGDELTYSPNDGSGIIVNTSVGIATTLTNQQKLFVAKIDGNLIGLATVRVGLGTTGTFVGIASTAQSSTTLFFTGLGTGVYHSFKTNYSVITGEILRNIVTVSTAQSHGLLSGNNVDINVNPSISTTFTFKYNDHNQKLLVNPQSFSAVGVNTTSSIIVINNHGFKTGDKILHTSTNPAQGLQNNSAYFIVKVNNDSFKLSDTYYGSTQLKPSIVGIASTSNGTLSLINPPIEVYKDSIITFDLSDSSLSYTNQSTQYPAFQLNFYLDENFINIYDKSIGGKTFEVLRNGTVGVSTDANVLLIVNKETPSILYYKLDPVYDGDLPTVKQKISVDNEVISNNRVISKLSIFNGRQTISVASTNSFTYTLDLTPESGSYISSTSSINYQTNSGNAYGSISEIEIENPGKNYYSLPGIANILTDSGSGAILEVYSNSIGKIKKTKIKDIGFDFPSDNTVRPSSSLPQIVKINSLASFESIGITSVGRGYTSSPKLLVFDGKTNNLVPEIDIKYNLGDSKVTILKNTYGINNVPPIILPTQNTNGVGISSVEFNTTTKNVTVILSVGFSTAGSFPFSINDKVLIENTSVGLGSTGKGFNSKNYDYQLFTLTSVDENIGGIGTVTFSLADFISGGEIVGNFDPSNSSGRIIPQKHFPIFNPVLITNNYFVGEVVKSTQSSISGNVESWDAKNSLLRISSNQNFIINEIIEGTSSKTQGVASSITSFESSYKLNSYSKVVSGWQTISGFLNNNLQRVQDSLYYQKFSYSLKSKIDFDTWSDTVGTLNHALGFKRFSDYQIESFLPEENKNSLVIGISTDVGYFEVITDLTTFTSLNCVYDFDLVKENSINFGSGIVSDEMIFSSRILEDHEESVGNRVLSIDDISGLFNSNPRATSFSIVNTFKLSDIRAQKYITFITDKRFKGERQLLLVDLIHDDLSAYINQYGRIETQYDMGSFDFTISGTDGQLLFYPTKFSVNDYDVTCLSYNLDDNLLGIGNTSIGGIVSINTNSVNLSAGISTTIVSIANTYSSVKVLVEITPDINNNEFEFIELNVVHDGTNIELLEYGQLSTTLTFYPSSGFGTYNAYFSGSFLNIDFVPNSGVGIGTTGVINTIQVGLANSSFSGIGTVDMKHARLEAKTTTISASGSPSENVISGYSEEYDAAYFIVQISDTTNLSYQMSEIVVVDDYISSLSTGDTYNTEYGVVKTSSGLGTIGTRVSAAGTVELLFTPNPNINIKINVYMNALRHQDDSKDIIDFNNGTIETLFSSYTGTERDIKRSFELKNKTNPIFEKYFDGSDASIVSISENSIAIPNHFFVSGENIVYYNAGAGSTQAIGIATTSMTGAGSTDKVPSGITESVFVVKVDENKIKLASSSTNALKIVPEVLNITSVGIGTLHRFVSTNQNVKVLLALDNIIQSPVVSTAVTTFLTDQVFTTDDILKFSEISSFFGNDLIKVDNEIMKIESIGIGSTNFIKVRRQWLGTSLAGYSAGQLVTKVFGNYNITDNIINFTEAPYGNIPLGTSTNPPDERDWTGIAKPSHFQGRTFIRSGIPNSSNETYHKNYIFNDISSGFNGTNRTFTLKSNGSNITGISAENAVILINDVFQGPGISYDYNLSENIGITSITFTGTATSITSDVNTSQLPIGGVILSVGSTAGLGYQPLVSAGGTVVVSTAGTVQSISVGNTGSGYRTSTNYQILSKTLSSVGIGSTVIFLQNENSVFGILNLLNTGLNCTIGVGTYISPTSIVSIASTFIRIGIGSTIAYSIPSGTSVSVNISNPQIGIVNVGVANSSVGVATVTHIGFATIISGRISSSVSITNPGTGYTITNPPIAIIDNPESYSSIPLQYSSSSVGGLGTGSVIDIVVGQGSSIIDFEIANTGFGYESGQILTVPTGGLTGIPTTFGFSEFQISVQTTFTDEFAGWTIGELESFDDFDDLFDGKTKTFKLKKAGNIKSIVAARGSNIVVQDVILIFINDILQVPGEGYIFTGGSVITFTEAPKIGDTSKIIFYKGSGSVDVISREIIETIKVGDELTIGYDASLGQEPYLQEDERTVTSIDSTDIVSTSPYFGPGNTTDENLIRPVVWCRQTEDKIIDDKEVGKDRELYEPNITPFAYVIKTVGIGSTVIFVDNIRPFFNPQNENNNNDFSFQNSIKLISQNIVSGAAATAVVSAAGTISSVVITDGGAGYSTATVSFGSTVGVGTTTQAFGSVIVSVGGIITGIAITNPGVGYTSSNPPQVLISSPVVTVEKNSVSSYSGDSGVIVGFGTTTQSSTDKLIFDFYIPQDSFLRNASLVGTAITLSSISVNDYFVVYDSNVGISTISIDNNNNIIGFGTNFVDNVYQVDSVVNVSVANTTIGIATIGTGTTTVRRVHARISGESAYLGVATSNYFGNFSWGKIQLTARTEFNQFDFYGDRRSGGITTSAIVQRTKPLKFKNYNQ